MSLHALMREYPWLKQYWYVALGGLLAVSIALVVLDGYLQVGKGRRRTARRTQRQQQSAQQAAETSRVLEGAAAMAAVNLLTACCISVS
jgi:hypothetical protein